VCVYVSYKYIFIIISFNFCERPFDAVRFVLEETSEKSENGHDDFYLRIDVRAGRHAQHKPLPFGDRHRTKPEVIAIVCWCTCGQY
jgi:hypothetical protein